MSSKVTVTITAIALLGSLAACASETVVHIAPPPDREEVVGTAPTPEDFWVRGSWRWDGEKYAWAQGHWEPRRRDAVWSPGHWRSQAAGGWVWVEGRWAPR
jgi:hypothetical protein